jgi:hypothetical protein
MKLPPWAPYAPPPLVKRDVLAVQALSTGTASAEQQQHALSFIVETLGRYYDLSYCPGPEGTRDTAMNEGRRFVAAQLVKMTKINVTTYFKET